MFIKGKYPKLKHPPILEALLDIKIAPMTEEAMRVFSELPEPFRSRFSERREIQGNSANIVITGDDIGVESLESVVNGYMHISETGDKVLQTQRDGFTLSHRLNYQSWDSFTSESRELWAFFQSKVKVSNVTRLALRYINEFELPLPFDSGDYFFTRLEIGDAIDVMTFPNSLFQTTVFKKGIGLYGNITQVIRNSDKSPNKAIVTFDIEVVKRGEVSVDQIWEMFDSLADFKNEIFFGSFTAKTIELFM